MSIMTGNLEPTSGIVEMRVGEDWVDMASPGTMPGAAPSLTSGCCTRNTTSTRTTR